MIVFIRRGHSNKVNVKEDRLSAKIRFRIAIKMAVLFGLGWIFGLAGTQALPDGVSVPFQILFTTLVGFQGLFIFLFNVVLAANVRKELKKLILRRGQTQHTRTYTSQKVLKRKAAQRKPHTSSAYIYKNVFSSKEPTSLISSLVAEEYDVCEPAELSGHQVAVTKLKSRVEYELHPCTADDFDSSDDEVQPAVKAEDTLSMIETTFTLPDDIKCPLQDTDLRESRAPTILFNPFTDDDPGLSQLSSDSSNDTPTGRTSPLT